VVAGRERALRATRQRAVRLLPAFVPRRWKEGRSGASDEKKKHPMEAERLKEEREINKARI
jgi:hypothetical protein